MLLIMDKIETMKAFSAVVAEGSFVKAAEKLLLSPQLVSKYVAQLEENLQTRLLNRTTRRVTLTEAGRSYFERCNQVLLDIEEMENSLGNLHQKVSGMLSISAPMSFAIHHLGALMVAFQKQYPEVDLNLQLTDKKIDILEDGIDIALRIGKLQDSALIAKKIAPINLVICASPEYLREYGVPIIPSDLQKHRYLRYVYSDNSTIFSQFEQSASALKFRSHFIANNGDLLISAAIEGGGVTIQPSFIAAKAIKEGKLQAILPAYAPEPLGLYAVYTHRKFLAAKVRCFIDFISDYYGDIPYWDSEV